MLMIDTCAPLGTVHKGTGLPVVAVTDSCAPLGTVQNRVGLPVGRRDGQLCPGERAATPTGRTTGAQNDVTQ